MLAGHVNNFPEPGAPYLGLRMDHWRRVVVTGHLGLCNGHVWDDAPGSASHGIKTRYKVFTLAHLYLVWVTLGVL